MPKPTASTKPAKPRVALMDPPWGTRTWSGTDAVPTQAADPYPTMTLEQMQALPIGSMMARDSVIAMWVIGTHLEQAFDLARAHGYSYVTDLFYWAKQRLIDAIGSADDERIRQEVAVFAVRIDVAEEITRIESHLDEIERLIKQGGELGKRLDFLIQELHREANTLGSKSAALELTHISVEMKVLIEQMREQVQNIE